MNDILLNFLFLAFNSDDDDTSVVNWNRTIGRAHLPKLCFTIDQGTTGVREFDQIFWGSLSTLRITVLRSKYIIYPTLATSLGLLSGTFFTESLYKFIQ